MADREWRAKLQIGEAVLEINLSNLDSYTLAMTGLIGLFGAFVGLFIWRIMRQSLNLRGSHFIWSSLFLIVGTILSVIFLSESAEELVGPTLHEMLPGQDYYSLVTEDPMMLRILTDYPGLEDELRSRIAHAKSQGGHGQIILEISRFSQEIGADYGPVYFSKGRTEDLLALVGGQIDTLRMLEQEHPQLCHAWLFGLDEDDVDLAKQIAREIPPEIHQLTSALIANALADVPEYDRALGTSMIETIAISMVVTYGDDGIALLAGERNPKNAQEEALVCTLFAGFYANILGLGDHSAEAALRSMFEAGTY